MAKGTVLSCMHRDLRRCSYHAFSGRSTRDHCARQETEDAARVRSIRHLADFLVESPTPMGEALRWKPGDTSLLGAGRRVFTLRGQVRAVRRFLRWLHGKTTASRFRRAFEQPLESPPGSGSVSRVTGGSFRNAHEAVAFLEGAAAIKTKQRLTSISLYIVGCKELLSKALQLGTPPSRHRACTLPCWRRWKK